eukprot:COSAG05_NODE_11027_length_534_cov_1.034483_1_plen_61_part_10
MKREVRLNSRARRAGSRMEGDGGPLGPPPPDAPRTPSHRSRSPSPLGVGANGSPDFPPEWD